MAAPGAPVHLAHMARSQKKPSWTKTYLREWRKHARLSLEAAAAEMGLTHGQLSKIERGLHPYSQRILDVAARLYRCTVADLLIRAPGEADDLFGLWARFDARQKRSAGRLLRTLVDED